MLHREFINPGSFHYWDKTDNYLNRDQDFLNIMYIIKGVRFRFI